MSRYNEKEKSTFWRIYKTVLIIAFAAVAIGLIYLTTVLKDYEQAQPKYVAEATFKAYFENFDAEMYAQQCSVEGSFDSVDAVIDSLKEITDGKKIEYYRVSTGMEKSYKYIVKADGVKFASFKLIEDNDADSRFTMYKAADFQLFVNGSEAVTVTVPAGYKVLLNGSQVSEEKIVEKDIPSENDRYLPKGVNGIKFVKYGISGLLNDPQVKVTDKDGKEATVTKLEDGSYKADPVYSEALKKEYNDNILKGMKRYSEYMQHSSNNPVTFGEISVYYDPSSDIYEDIKTEENMFVYDYNSVEYQNEETSEYIQYDDNTFSCRVKFVQILHKDGENDYKDTIDTTLFLRKVDGEFLIYNRKLN